MCNLTKALLLASKQVKANSRVVVRGSSVLFEGMVTSSISLEKTAKKNVYTLSISACIPAEDGLYTSHEPYSFKKDILIDDIASQLYTHTSKKTTCLQKFCKQVRNINIPQVCEFDNFDIEEDVLKVWVIALDLLFDPNINLSKVQAGSRGKKIREFSAGEGYEVCVYSKHSTFKPVAKGKNRKGFACELEPAGDKIKIKLGFRDNANFISVYETPLLKKSAAELEIAAFLSNLTNRYSSSYIDQQVNNYFGINTPVKSKAWDAFVGREPSDTLVFTLLSLLQQKWHKFCNPEEAYL